MKRHPLESRHARSRLCDCGATVQYNTVTGTNVKYKLGELTTRCPECKRWLLLSEKRVLHHS